MVNIDKKYKLYRINLDAYDLKHFEDTKKNKNSLFYGGYREPIYSYDEKDVNYLPLVNMHCRGSSYKREIDFDEKLIVIVLHEFNLYIWVQMHHFNEL